MSQDRNESSSQPASSQVIMHQGYYPPQENDEINLFDLFELLWRRKNWIAGITGVITCIAIVYSYLLTPAYEAVIYLLPPQTKDIDALNLYAEKEVNKEGITVKAYNQENVYQHAVNNINSRQYQWDFFQHYKLLDLYSKNPDKGIRDKDIFNKQFRQSIRMEKGENIGLDKGKEKTIHEIEVYFTLPDREKAATVLNDYITFVNVNTVSAIVNDIKESVRLEKRRLTQDIERMRRDAFLRRQDRIIQIKEQLTIARKLKIKTGNMTGSVATLSGEKGYIPSYLEGTNALQAKLDALEKRKSDDAYIPQLRELQARLALLDEVVIDEKNIQALKIDQEALPPNYPIKPRKRLIVSFAFILGVMISIFIVFVWHFIEQYRQEKA